MIVCVLVCVRYEIMKQAIDTGKCHVNEKIGA